jgi:hypothetical protein
MSSRDLTTVSQIIHSSSEHVRSAGFSWLAILACQLLMGETLAHVEPELLEGIAAHPAKKPQHRAQRRIANRRLIVGAPGVGDKIIARILSWSCRFRATKVILTTWPTRPPNDSDWDRT